MLDRMAPVKKAPAITRAILAALLLSLGVAAQGTFIVDPGGNGDFTDIQSAVDAANPGDLIRVREGSYADPVLITKGLRIVGDGDDPIPPFTKTKLLGGVVVRDIPTEQSFIASDLFVSPGITIENCAGNVHLDGIRALMRITNCEYLTANECGELSRSNVPPALEVEDSVAVFSSCSWLGFSVLHATASLTRSRVTFVSSHVIVIGGGGFASDLPSAVDVIDSEFLYDISTTFRVGCDTWANCPPFIRRIGNSFVAWFNGSTLVAEQEENTLDLTLLNQDPATMTAILASPPRKPIDLPNGTLYLDLPKSFFLFLGVPPAEGPVLSLPIPQTVEKLGIPVTVQAAELINGEVRLSLPTTIVL